MKPFLAGFDKLFPEIEKISNLAELIREAEATSVPDQPRKPTEYSRTVPTAISLDRVATSEFAELVGLHADELGLLLKNIFTSDNPIIIDAFKKLISATKICTEVADELNKHRKYERERFENYQEEVTWYNKMLRARKKAIKDKADEVTRTKAAHRKAWLDYVRKLEARFNAAGGDVKKLNDDDAIVVARAKRGTKKGDPFGFLRNQKGDKCAALLEDLQSDLKRKLVERGVKAILKNVKNVYHLGDALAALEKDDADEVFDTYMRRRAYEYINKDGEWELDTRKLTGALMVGLNKKLPSAESWQKTFAEFEERDEVRRRNRHLNSHNYYGKYDKYGRIMRDFSELYQQKWNDYPDE